MTVSITRGTSDDHVESIRHALSRYKKEHAKAKLALYRRNPGSIRIRIIDPAFARTSLADRHELVWSYLDELPDVLQGQISMLVLLTPAEAKTSLANDEFDNPSFVNDTAH